MSPARVQRTRRKGFRMPADTIYVGRGTIFGNPWRVERIKPTPGDPREYVAVLRGHLGIDHVHPFETYREAARRAVAGYRVYLIRGDGPALSEIARLRGKDLGCWCALDMPCHADVLLELANTDSPALADVPSTINQLEGDS